MLNSTYHHLDKLIDEYEEDRRIIKIEKFIMVNYPKAYVMAIASSFERQIKKCCQDFIDFPLLTITSYPKINFLIKSTQRKKPVVDIMFDKFHTCNRTSGKINLNANKFYDFFGGITFKNKLKINYNLELNVRFGEYKSLVDDLTPLLDKSEKYDRDYAKNTEIKDRLSICTFDSAENAFLSLKLRRNEIAHDYINGISDTFEDIRNFYLDAVVYVIALEKTIMDITNISDIHPLP